MVPPRYLNTSNEIGSSPPHRHGVFGSVPTFMQSTWFQHDRQGTSIPPCYLQDVTVVLLFFFFFSSSLLFFFFLPFFDVSCTDDAVYGGNC